MNESLKNKNQVQVRFRDADLRRIDRVVAKTGATRSGFIRSCVRKELDRQCVE